MLMHWQPALPERYRTMTPDVIGEAIEARRVQLGEDLLILGHHYQQDDVIRHADLTGDSLKLSRLAAVEASRRGTRFIVFCGVHFMAETADLLTDESVAVILPDLAAGCSMADMADLDDAMLAWDSLQSVLEESPGGFSGRIVPITYVNSTAAIKAFVGERGGACCTSGNAMEVFLWALAGGAQRAEPGEDIRVFFLPDQHLGRNTAARLGYTTDRDAAPGAPAETALWNPRKPLGGLTPEQIRAAKVLLWAGHCSVHMLFRPEHVIRAREMFADQGGVRVIVHPECSKEVVDLADEVGSTEQILRAIETAPPGSNWAVGTEVHLVNRVAQSAAARGVHVRMLSDCQCLCTTMYRIDPPHLLWALDNLAKGRIVNRVEVASPTREGALLAVERMLALGAAPRGETVRQ
jgi:quinolinate synthase